jgi:hypothetical protein
MISEPIPRPSINESVRRTLAARRAVRAGAAALMLGLTAALLVLGDGPQAMAQPQKPYANRPKYPEIPVNGDVEKILEGWFQEIENEQQFNEKLKEWIKKYQDKEFKLNPEDVKNIDLKNPLIQKKIKDLLDQPGLKNLPLQPGEKEKIKDFLKTIEDPTPEPPDPIKGNGPDPGEPPTPPGPLPGGTSSTVEPPKPGELPVTDPGESDDPLKDDFDGILEWLEHSELGKMLMESDEFRNFILNEGLFPSDLVENPFDLDSEGLASWLGKIPNMEMKNALPSLSSFGLDKISSPKMPKFKMPMTGFGGIGGPVSPGMPGAGLSAGGAVVVVLLLLGVGVVVTLLLMSTRWMTAGRARNWHPGPWPVNPAGVTTRGDLVKAFEYLALLLLGRQAEHFNHRTIADQLSAQPESATERQQAADQLAQMYEQARYAPAEETLTPDDLQRARHNLCSLAGAAKA